MDESKWKGKDLIIHLIFIWYPELEAKSFPFPFNHLKFGKKKVNYDCVLKDHLLTFALFLSFLF